MAHKLYGNCTVYALFLFFSIINAKSALIGDFRLGKVFMVLTILFFCMAQ